MDLIIKQDEDGYIHAEELIYCKDCKHRDPEDMRCDSGCLFTNKDYIMPDEWYCAGGEKKDEV